MEGWVGAWAVVYFPDYYDVLALKLVRVHISKSFVVLQFRVLFEPLVNILLHNPGTITARNRAEPRRAYASFA